MAPTYTKCERCGHMSTKAHLAYNRGICAACWKDIEDFEEFMDLDDDILI